MSQHEAGSWGHSLSESAQIWAAVRKQKLLQCRSCSSSRVKFLWATLSLSSPHTRGCVLRGQIVLLGLSDDRDIDINSFSSPHISCNLCLGPRGGGGGQGGRDLNGSAHKAPEKPFDDRKANAVPQLKMPTALQLKIKLQCCKTIACTLELQMKG